jgi:hypothetical protein
VRPCGERSGEVGLLRAEDLEALTVATHAFLAECGRELAAFECLEVAVELAPNLRDLRARRGELLLDARPLLGGARGRVGERAFDQTAVACGCRKLDLPANRP